MGYEELKREFDNTAFRRKLKEAYPCQCSNCGTDKNIEYHHIVPLKLGGTNALTNIIPLCHKCHRAAHCGQHMSKYADSANGGRKPKATIENSSEVFDAYINGEIGNRKCKELLGYSERTTIPDRAEFKRYISSKGIKRVHNTVDIAGVFSAPLRIQNGVYVGEVEYINGDISPIYFKDTGKNNIKYTARRYT